MNQTAQNKTFDGDDFEFTELVARYYEGEITKEDFALLQSAMQADESRYDKFVAFGSLAMLLSDELSVRTETSLEDLAAGDLALTSNDVASSKKPSGGRGILATPLKWAYAAAASIAIIGTLVNYFAQSTGVISTPSETDVSLFRLIDSRNSSDSKLLFTDTPAVGQHIKFESGFMELRFAQGARVLFEGPADFSVDSSNAISVAKGSVSAFIPLAAAGFTVSTPNIEVLGPSTSSSSKTTPNAVYGIRVESGITEVHVFSGNVDLKRITYSKKSRIERILGNGRAVRVGSGQSPIVGIALESDQFIRTQSSKLQWLTVFEDHFDQSEMDLARWNVSVLDKESSATVSMGRVELENHGYLIASRQFNPVALRGIRVAGVWSSGRPTNNHSNSDPKKTDSSLSPNYDELNILIRAAFPSTSPNGSQSFNGILFQMNSKSSQPTIKAIGNSHVIDGVQSFGHLEMSPDKSYDFELIDSGIELSLKVTEVGNPENTTHIKALLYADDSPTDFVVFYGPQRIDGGGVTHLDDLEIAAGILAK
jgi:hypothetical protein